MSSLLEKLEEYDREFWARTRYVIHGKSDSQRFSEMAWGFGIVPESSDRVYLWNELTGAKDYLADRRKESIDKSIPDEFEIREVQEDDLKGIYLKARII